MFLPKKGSDQVIEAAWYVIFTKPNQEQRAFENLNNQGFECFLPVQIIEKIRRNSVVEIKEALFPRYIFIRLETGISNWSLIRSTRGVVRLVEFGGIAAKLPDQLMTALAGQALHRQERFSPDDKLLIVDGPFAGIEAEMWCRMESAEGQVRVMVLMEILSKQQKLAFRAEALRKIA